MLLTTGQLSQGTCPKMAQTISPLCQIPAGRLELIHSQPQSQVGPARECKGDRDSCLGPWTYLRAGDHSLPTRVDSETLGGL